MYFFDFEDYWRFNSDSWSETGNGGSVVGCGGGAIPSDWEDLLGTGRATRDAFKKAVAEWFITSAQSGFTQNIDQGCSPTYLNLWVDMIEKEIEFDKYVEILRKTLFLFRFNYDYNLSKQATYPTYEDYFVSAYADYDQETGTTTNTVNVPINPFPPIQYSAVSVTYDYGTSFENSDLETFYTGYDTSMKEYMCSIKNMWSVIDGDTFDELWVDDNGNFIPNSGTTYCLI